MIKEIKDDIWNYFSNSYIITITTNGFVKNNGR